MKKNIDEMTAKLFTAVKTAYLRECSGLVRNNGKCQPVTVDMMAQLLNGRQVDKIQVAEGTDPNKVIDLMEGYSCGLASLPRIYKQVARLAGETCEKITVYQDALQPYGFDYEAAANKDNKKVVAVIKKYCKVDDLRPYIGVVYHDAERHNAIWTDANVMIVSKALYNPAAADTAAAEVEKVEENAPAFVTVGDMAVPNITPIMPADPRPEVGEVGDRVKYKYSDYEGTIIQSWYHDIYLNEWRCTVVLDDGKEIHPTIKNLTILTAAEPMEDAPAATVTDADVLAQAERIKAIYEDMKAEAVEGMKADDLPDTTPIYTAADVERMIEEATADTYTAEEVAAMVAAAVAEERARHTRRRFAPRLRPVLRRLGRVAAVVLPLLLVALFIGASTASAPAADAAAVTTCQAAETVAQVVELPAVTVTAAAVTDTPATPSPVKKLAAPSPVKNAAADAVTLPGQKTASDIATATAPAAPLAPAADADGLTICEGTPWAYTMMNWA